LLLQSLFVAAFVPGRASFPPVFLVRPQAILYSSPEKLSRKAIQKSYSEKLSRKAIQKSYPVRQEIFPAMYSDPPLPAKN
tara:strand:+ start:14751 stop:14990 length:240 start_codon:yes stop_codon:yes gene_type:complete